MPADVFLEQYRITSPDDSAPREIARNGPAVTYRAADLKSGAPVALTLIPIASVDPSERERFEEKARAAMLLDHINIARTVAFGVAADSFVYVSEYPSGETLQSWVKSNGPMPADAVLRVGLQVVAAVAAASFHGLTHPAIQPSNLIIVPGKTTEGGWPFVKLTHFALAGLKSAPGHVDPDVSASDFASPEQMLQGKADFRSEIYSLGATMCFLLTGVFYSAYPRSPQTRRFARPLRHLIARTLEDDPDLRPQDPVLFTEDLRNCLVAIERRQSLQQRFGIPFRPIVARPPRLRIRRRKAHPTPLLATIGPTAPPPPEVVSPSRSRWRPALAIAACLLVIGLISALFLPEDVVTAALHRNKSAETVGVPVGVPDGMAANSRSASSAAALPINQPGGRLGSSSPVSQTQQPIRATSSSSVSTQQATPAIPPVVAQQSAAPPSSAPAPTTPPIVAQQSAQRSSGESGHPELPDAHKAASPQPPITMAANTQAGNPNPDQARVNESVASTRAATPTAAAPLAAASPVSEATPPAVAANNNASEPAPPAESSADDNAEASLPPPDANESADSPEESRDTTPPEPSSPSKKSTSRRRNEKARLKKSLSMAQSRTRSRVPRTVPAEADTPPGRPGTIRARVAGITPNGNVVLVLPSGERAIVAPQDADRYSRGETTHRRPRRVIIERRTVPVSPQYPPPYQPFIPPDA